MKNNLSDRVGPSVDNVQHQAEYSQKHLRCKAYALRKGRRNRNGKPG